MLILKECFGFSINMIVCVIENACLVLYSHFPNQTPDLSFPETVSSFNRFKDSAESSPELLNIAFVGHPELSRKSLYITVLASSLKLHSKL